MRVCSYTAASPRAVTSGHEGRLPKRVPEQLPLRHSRRGLQHGQRVRALRREPRLRLSRLHILVLGRAAYDSVVFSGGDPSRPSAQRGSWIRVGGSRCLLEMPYRL